MPSAPSLEPDSAAIDSDIESDIESVLDGARVDAARIDPEELAIALRVLATLSEVDEEDPDFLTVRHATAKMFKSVKVCAAPTSGHAIADADRAVIAATATGAPTASTTRRGASRLATRDRRHRPPASCSTPRACYICKQPLHAGRRVLPPALPAAARR